MKTNSFKITALSILAGVGLILASCGNKDTEQVQAANKVPVQIATAQLTDYPVVYSFSGKLEADKQSKLSTRIMGQISRIHVKPGQKVKKGQLLIQIRNQDILAKKAQVEASKVEATSASESAEKDLKRYEALYKSKSASDKEIDDMRSHFKMAKARLNAVEQMEKEIAETMRYASIRAPYNGVITSKFVQEGDMANPGMPLLGMESPSQWKVIARIPEADIARIQLNDTVTVEFKALNTQLEGTIAEINPSASMGNQFEAKIILNSDSNNFPRLYSGMHATTHYESGTQKYIQIHESALIQKGQLVGLYAVSQTGTALLRWVKTGKVTNGSVEILSGLADGEKYILSSKGKLMDGALVENN